MAKKKPEKDPKFADGSIIVPGADSHIIDSEDLGEKVMASIKRTPEQSILIWMRDQFKRGMVMYATDVGAPILEPVMGDNGEEAWATGLTIRPLRRDGKVENPK